MTNLRKAYLEACQILIWFNKQFTDYTVEQCKVIESGAQTDETRAAFGMLWRVKEWFQKYCGGNLSQ